MVTGIIAVIALTLINSMAGLLIAFLYCWQIAIITLAFTPFLVMGISMNTSVSKIMHSKS